MDIGREQWRVMNRALKWPGTEAEFESALRDLASPTYYPVLCAWCERDGRRTRLGWSTVAHSHGICTEHQAQLRAQHARIKASTD